MKNALCFWVNVLKNRYKFMLPTVGRSVWREGSSTGAARKRAAARPTAKATNSGSTSWSITTRSSMPATIRTAAGSLWRRTSWPDTAADTPQLLRSSSAAWRSAGRGSPRCTTYRPTSGTTAGSSPARPARRPLTPGGVLTSTLPGGLENSNCFLIFFALRFVDRCRTVKNNIFK